MPYKLLPHITLLLAIVAILILIARRLPQALSDEEREGGKKPAAAAHQAVLGKAPSRVWATVRFWVGRAWQFILEAKGMQTPMRVRYRLQRWFGTGSKRAAVRAAATQPQPEYNEQYYLGRIEERPKDMARYDALGIFYLGAKRFAEARDVYEYLAKKEADNPLYYSRLAYAHFKLGQFEGAVENYKKSLTLDSAQPNRYYNLGLSLDAAGHPEEAIEAFTKALELEPSVYKYHEAKESVKGKLGKSEE